MPQIDDQISQLLNGFLLVICLMIPVVALFYLARIVVRSSLRNRKRKGARDLRRLLPKVDAQKRNGNLADDAPKLTPLSAGTVARPVVVESSVQELIERKQSDFRAFLGTVGAYGYGLDGDPFHEEALLLDVNASGGVLLLSVPVREGENLLLTNDSTFETHICRIVRVGARNEQTVEVAVEFPSPCPEFLRILSKAESSPTQVRPATMASQNAEGDWKRDVKHRASGGSS